MMTYWGLREISLEPWVISINEDTPYGGISLISIAGSILEDIARF
jgi:hypothetical protein